ncbi:hypothetical protein PAMP_010160 [Pampus punctatissimus]
MEKVGDKGVTRQQNRHGQHEQDLLEIKSDQTMTVDGDGDMAGPSVFTPQKEIVYNGLLPYSDRLDREATELLAEIKANLSRAVLLRELWPGVAFWSRKLFSFLKLYGRRFSKEDHILFIKLLYELVTLPNLEPHMMQSYARLLIQLLKKKELLSRDDLQLPWRPLYDLYDRVVYSKTEHLGLIWFPSSVDHILKALIKSCRLYFPASSTKEMLEEWRPLLCVFDMIMQKAVGNMELFLPTVMPPEEHSQGFQLWFDELMTLWVSVQNQPSWEGHLVNLFARLANDNIGYVDWNPYIPTIFTRILRSLNLPVGVSQMVAPRYLTNSYDIGHLVLWITALLSRLMRLLQRLPASVVRRVHRERHAAPSWITLVPECQRLTDTDLQEFTRSLIGAALQAMFSKTGSTDAAYALQNLALLTPELAIPPVLEKTYAAMETLTEPHTLTATLSCMIGMARSLVSPNNHYPEGRTHVLPLLMGSLPGVDPNDFSKCMITFQFIATFTTLVPLVDCSSAPSRHSDLTETEKDLCFASAEFEDFILQFLDRCFALIDSSTLEQTRDETETDTQTHLESLVELGLSSTVALQKVYNFATSNIFETCVSGRMVADMCRAAAKVTRVDGEQLLKYQEDMERILSVCVRLRCKRAYTLACSLLEHTLRSLSLIYPTEYRSTSGGFDTDLPIQDWGRAGDVAALGVCWHVPSQEEENFVFQLLSRLLHPELERIKGHVSGDHPMSRYDSRENYRESICQIMRLLLRTHKKEFDSRWKSFTLVKKSMENRLHGKKQHIRALLIDRVLLQHEMRKLVVDGSEYKVVHQELLCDLLLLSTSTYSQGALYCLLGVHNSVCQASVRDWDCVGEVWPALVRCGLSPSMTLEKSSIGRLLDDITDRIHRQHDTIGIYFTVSENCVEIANQITQSKNPTACLEAPSIEELKEGLQRQRIRNVVAARKYEKLVNDLLDCLEDRELPWKFEHMATDLLSLLLRDDHPLPPDAVLFFTQSLIHDSISIRKVAISAMAAIMKQLKRPRQKVSVKPSDISGIEDPEGVCVGDREGNHWLQYDSSNLPLSEEQWDSQHYVEKTHWGYYSWPREMMIYAPSEKPKDDLPYEKMSEGEKIIFEYFSDPEFIDQLIEFLSLEDRKGKDSFNPRRFCLFKGLFRNYGDVFLPLLWPHLEQLASDPHESSQRCVCEITAGLIRGSKLWSFSKVDRLWQLLCPLIRTALTNITVETFTDWGTCIATACVVWPSSSGEYLNCCTGYWLTWSPNSPRCIRMSGSALAEFVTRVLERLKPLTSEPEIHNHVHEENTQETDERTQAVKLLKTGQNGLLYPEHIPLVLAALEEMAGSRSWHARFSVLTYLQIMVFYNLFTLLSVPAEVLCIRKLVMQLLLDEQLELNSASILAAPPPPPPPPLPPPPHLQSSEGHGRHHPQWFTAVPVLPPGLQSADTAPDAESDSSSQGQRRASLHSS